MKKKMNKILLMIVFLVLISMNFYIADASEASLSANNCTEGESVSITITMPSDAVGYNGKIYITYSDGTASTPKSFAKLNYDFNTNTYSPAGNYSTTFDGNISGNAIVKVEGLVLTDSKNQQLNSTTSLSTTVYIAPKQTTPPVVEPETPSTENNSSSNNSGSNSNSGTTTQPPKTTTPKVLTFKDVNDTVYTVRRINLRQNYGTTGGLIKTLAQGEELTRTGISTSADEDGYYWSRVSYNGTTGYVITGGVSNEKPAEPEPENEVVNNTVANEIDNTVNEVANNTILNEVDANELTQITEKIGVLPEVGNNFMVNMFFGTVAVAVIMMIIVKKNRYEE